MTTIRDMLYNFGRTVAEIEADPDYTDKEAKDMFEEELDIAVEQIEELLTRILGK